MVHYDLIFKLMNLFSNLLMLARETALAAIYLINQHLRKKKTKRRWPKYKDSSNKINSRMKS